MGFTVSGSHSIYTYCLHPALCYLAAFVTVPLLEHMDVGEMLGDALAGKLATRPCGLLLHRICLLAARSAFSVFSAWFWSTSPARKVTGRLIEPLWLELRLDQAPA